VAGDSISNTQSAMVLESLISQFLYSKAADGSPSEANKSKK
jgi:phospholipid/cholesterol/gamma-HCH transport system substrate-binding protein